MSKVNKKKITLKEFVWYGFNAICGLGFEGVFYATSNLSREGQKNDYAIGMNTIWVFILLGVIAMICTWSFSRMIRIHHSSHNGGAYIYSRTNISKYYGFLILFLLYLGIPFLITIQILFLLQGFFNQEFSGLPQFQAHLGPFTNLWLDLIGIFIYISCASIIFVGIKWWKKANNWSGVMRWITFGIFIAAVLYLGFKNGRSTLHYWTQGKGHHISWKGIIYSFNSLFFCYAGFENFATSGRNIENPEKNIGKGLIIIIFLACIFYTTLAFLFYLGYNHFYQNMATGGWLEFKNIKWIFYSGSILMMLSLLAMKIQTSSQYALYGATMIQPMAKEGFISDKLRKLNKDHIPVKAVKWNLIITLVVLFFWLIIPDIITGYMTDVGHGIKSYTTYKIPNYDIGSFTIVSSLFSIFIYISVILCNIKLWFEKKIKLKLWEIISFSIALLFLSFLFIYHYYNLIYNDLIIHKRYINTIIELTFTITVFVIFNIIYFMYYKTKYNYRLKYNPSIQKNIDKDFVVEDEWSLLVLELDKTVLDYLKRNKTLYKNNKNKNYELAKQIHDKLQIVKDEYNKQLEENILKDGEYVDE